eukprot:GEMP01004701.1.p1 GENE.GEMP01004701.1~~GEMP01004701.1.p1  ORF type:complete len:1197 (+),score=317.93 GEMP01004701.1:189-3779(+)
MDPAFDRAASKDATDDPTRNRDMKFQEWAAEVRNDLPGLSKAHPSTDATRGSASSVKVLNPPKSGGVRVSSPIPPPNISKNTPATSSYSATTGREFRKPKVTSISYASTDGVLGSADRAPSKESSKASDSRATDFKASDSHAADFKALPSLGLREASSASKVDKRSSVNARIANGSFVGNNLNMQQRAQFLASLPRPNDAGISNFLQELSERDDTRSANAELQRRIRVLEQQAKPVDANGQTTMTDAAEFKVHQLESELATERGQHAGHLRGLQKTIAEEKQRHKTLVVERDEMEEELQMEIRKMSTDSEKDDSWKEEFMRLKKALAQAREDIDTWQRNAHDSRKELSQVKYDYDILQNESHAISDMRDQVRSSVATISALEEENHDMSYEVDTLKEKMEIVKERFSIDMKKRGTSQKLTGRCLRAWYLYVGQAIMRENFSIIAGSALRTVTGEKFRSKLRRIFSEWRFHAHCGAMESTMHSITEQAETRDLEANKHMHEVELIISERDQAVLDMKRKDVECSALRAELGTQALTLKEEKEAAERAQEEMALMTSEYVDARSGSSVPEYELAKARVDFDDLRRELQQSNERFDDMVKERDWVIEHHGERVRHMEETEEEARQRCVFLEESLLHEEATQDIHQAELHDHIEQLEAQLRDFHDLHDSAHPLPPTAWSHGAPTALAAPAATFSYPSSVPVVRTGSPPSGLVGRTPSPSYMSGPSMAPTASLGVHQLSSSQGGDMTGFSGPAVMSPHSIGDGAEIFDESPAGPILHSIQRPSALRASSLGEAHRPHHLTHSASLTLAPSGPSHTAIAQRRLSSPRAVSNTPACSRLPNPKQRQPPNMTGLKQRLLQSIAGASSTAETPAHKFSAEVEKLERRLYGEERVRQRDTEEQAIEFRLMREFEERIEKERRSRQQNNDDQAAEIRHLADILHNIRVQSPFTSPAEEPSLAGIPASSSYTENAVAPESGLAPSWAATSAHAVGPPVPCVELSSGCLPKSQSSINGGPTHHTGSPQLSGHLHSNNLHIPPPNHPSVSTQQLTRTSTSHGALHSDARHLTKSYPSTKPAPTVTEATTRSSVRVLPNPRLGHKNATEHTQSTPQLLRHSAELSQQNPRESTPPSRTVGSGCGFGFESGKVVCGEDVRLTSSPTHRGSRSSAPREDAMRRGMSTDGGGRSGLRRSPHSHNGFGPVPPLHA